VPAVRAGWFPALLLIALAGAPGAAQDEATADQVDAWLASAHDRMSQGPRHLAEADRLDAEGHADGAAAARARAAQGYAEAEASYGRVLAALPGLNGVGEELRAEVRRIALYNQACARARLGRADPALAALEAALQAGYDDLARARRDPDLAALRELQRFEDLLARATARRRAAEAREAGAALSSEPLFPYDLDVTTLDGERLRLADLAGKVVIVDYWGTWCGPCRAELPHFVRLAAEYGDRLAVVGMTWERGQGGPEVIARVRAFAAELGVRYPLVLVTDDAELARVPRLEAFPTTLFLDRRGRVRARETGYRDLAALRALVEALLAEGSAPAETD